MFKCHNINRRISYYCLHWTKAIRSKIHCGPLESGMVGCFWYLSAQIIHSAMRFGRWPFFHTWVSCMPFDGTVACQARLNRSSNRRIVNAITKFEANEFFKRKITISSVGSIVLLACLRCPSMEPSLPPSLRRTLNRDQNIWNIIIKRQTICGCSKSKWHWSRATGRRTGPRKILACGSDKFKSTF